MLRDAFFPQRLHRLNYFFRALALNCLDLLLLAAIEEGIEIGGIPMILEVIALVLVIYGVLFVYRPRVIDCGMPVWTLIFAFAPFIVVFEFAPYIAGFYGIILLFRPSELGFLYSSALSLSPEDSDDS